MPAAIPWITLAITAASGGVGIEKALTAPDPNDAIKKSEQAQQAQAAADAKKQQEADAAQRAQALRLAAPNAQAQTGGSLTDSPFASLTSSIAGTPGNIQEALRALGMDNDPASSQTQQPGLSMSGGS